MSRQVRIRPAKPMVQAMQVRVHRVEGFILFYFFFDRLLLQKWRITIPFLSAKAAHAVPGRVYILIRS